MATAVRTVNYEDWLRMPLTSDAREEVVNGEARILPPNKWPHHQAVRRLVRIIARQVNEDEVDVVADSFGLVIRKNPLTTRTPDIAVFVLGNMALADGYVHSAPELVVEVLSPGNSRSERDEKMLDYASIGVPEVWIVAPEDRTVEILQLAGERLRTTSLLKSGVVTPLRFPLVRVIVDQIWEG